MKRAWAGKWEDGMGAHAYLCARVARYSDNDWTQVECCSCRRHTWSVDRCIAIEWPWPVWTMPVVASSRAGSLPARPCNRYRRSCVHSLSSLVSVYTHTHLCSHSTPFNLLCPVMHIFVFMSENPTHSNNMGTHGTWIRTGVFSGTDTITHVPSPLVAGAADARARARVQIDVGCGVWSILNPGPLVRCLSCVGPALLLRTHKLCAMRYTGPPLRLTGQRGAYEKWTELGQSCPKQSMLFLIYNDFLWAYTSSIQNGSLKCKCGPPRPSAGMKLWSFKADDLPGQLLCCKWNEQE
jgi:hypothetical protein